MYILTYLGIYIFKISSNCKWYVHNNSTTLVKNVLIFLYIFFLGDIPANRALVKDNSVLSLRNVIPEDQDTYVCRADNPAGSAQVKASVQVHCKFKVYNMILLKVT